MERGNLSGIYCITINNKRYIGQTLGSFNKRRNEHLRTLLSGTSHNMYLQQAFNKYGDFKFEILQVCDNYTKCNDLEVGWINYYNTTNRNNGYNILEGGSNCNLPHEQKELISQRALGRKTNRNTSGHVGVCWNPRTRSWWARISNYETGKREKLGYFQTMDEAVKAYNKRLTQFKKVEPKAVGKNKKKGRK